MSHDFVDIDLPFSLREEYVFFNTCKKCNKCNMIVGANYYGDNDKFNDDFFFINNVEVFKDFYKIEELDLTCEEILIKFLLE